MQESQYLWLKQLKQRQKNYGTVTNNILAKIPTVFLCLLFLFFISISLGWLALEALLCNSLFRIKKGKKNSLAKKERIILKEKAAEMVAQPWLHSAQFSYYHETETKSKKINMKDWKRKVNCIHQMEKIKKASESYNKHKKSLT